MPLRRELVAISRVEDCLPDIRKIHDLARETSKPIANRAIQFSLGIPHVLIGKIKRRN